MTVSKGFLCVLLISHVLSVSSFFLNEPEEDGLTTPSPIVRTTNGLVQGETLRNGWYRYRGIPYAEPPVGYLRFQVNIYIAIRMCIYLI